MKIGDIIQSANSNERMPDIAKKLGVSKDVLRDTLKKCGYSYSNTAKRMIFIGEESDKDKIDNTLFSDIRQTNKPKAPKAQAVAPAIPKKASRDTSETSQKAVRASSDLGSIFTPEEIQRLKRIAQVSAQSQLFLEVAQLPDKGELKKHSIEISKDTFEAFNAFADQYSKKRISKNDLIEIALVRLMREFT